MQSDELARAFWLAAVTRQFHYFYPYTRRRTVRIYVYWATEPLSIPKHQDTMSQCPQCYTGTCRRHILQDDGRSSIKANDPKVTLSKMYELMVGSKLKELEKEKAREVSSTERTSKSFRAKLDAEREKTLKKAVGSSKRRRERDHTSGNGLNPQALAAILSSPSTSSSEETVKEKKRKKSHEAKYKVKTDKSGRKKAKRRKQHRKSRKE